MANTTLVIELTKAELRKVEKVCQANGWSYFTDLTQSWDTYNQDSMAASVNANKFLVNANKLSNYIIENGIDNQIDIEFGFDVLAYIEANKVLRNTLKSW